MWKKRLGLALWLIAAGALCFFENNTGTRVVFAASAILPLLSVLCAFFAFDRVHVIPELPESCPEGAEAKAICRVLGPKWLLTLCTVGYTAELRNMMTDEAVVITEAHADSANQYSVDTSVCGTLQLRIIHVTVSDWLGVLVRRKEAAAASESVILPELYPVDVTVADPQNGMDLADFSARTLHGPGDTIGVREYIPGDPVHLIHYKLSEKLDRTMLRETGSPAEMPLLFLL